MPKSIISLLIAVIIQATIQTIATRLLGLDLTAAILFSIFTATVVLVIAKAISLFTKEFYMKESIIGAIITLTAVVLSLFHFMYGGNLGVLFVIGAVIVCSIVGLIYGAIYAKILDFLGLTIDGMKCSCLSGAYCIAWQKTDYILNVYGNGNGKSRSGQRVSNDNKEKYCKSGNYDKCQYYQEYLEALEASK